MDDSGLAKFLACIALMLSGGLCGGGIGALINSLFIKTAEIPAVTIGCVSGILLAFFVGAGLFA